MQESPQPRALESPKSLKKVFLGLPAGSVKKVSKKSANTDFLFFFDSLSVLWDFFDTFDTSGRQAREDLLRLLGISGLGGADTPVYCGSNRKSLIYFVRLLLEKYWWLGHRDVPQIGVSVPCSGCKIEARKPIPPE